MRNPWFYKKLSTVYNSVQAIQEIVMDLSIEQERKLNNYLPGLEGSPNYELSEERLELFSEIEELVEELVDKISEMI